MYFERNYRLMLYGPQMINVLSKPVEEDEFPELLKLRDYMIEVARICEVEVLAAPQVGLFKQVIIYRERGKFSSLVNPEITRLYGREVIEEESCPSLPPSGNGCPVARTEFVNVEASTVELPEFRRRFQFSGPTARIIQLQIDLLHGTFFVDRVSERKKKDVLDRFRNWKSMRLAQMRAREDSKHVNAGFVAAYRGSARLS